MSIDLSLDRLQRLITHLPLYSTPTCHIAGTNGKGSVAAILSSIFLSSSLSVGRYNSPHLVSVNDCITINNVPISPSLYTSLRTQVESANKTHNANLSSFELLTLTALLAFQHENVDIAVVEVGLGGRLDATNIIADECILISALAAVDLDHQAFLGNTVEEIAQEKAAIARKDRNFVMGPQKYAGVEDVVRRVVQSNSAVLVHSLRVEKREWDVSVDGPEKPGFSFAAGTFEPPAPQPVKATLPCFSAQLNALLPLYGDHQLDNLGTALTVVSTLLTTTTPSIPIYSLLKSRVTEESVVRGIHSVRWPGRLSFHTLTVPNTTTTGTPTPLVVLADGAHNPASSTTLGKYISHLLLSAESPKHTLTLTYILALSHSPPKTPLQTLSPLLLPPPLDLKYKVNVNVAALRFTPPEGMPWVKSVHPAEIKKVVEDLVPGVADIWVEGEENARDGIGEAIRWTAGRTASGDGEMGLVVLAGSLYLVADFYRYLGEK